MAPEIRPYTPRDAAAIAPMLQSFYREVEAPMNRGPITRHDAAVYADSVLQELGNGCGYSILLASERAKLLGYLAMKRYTNAADPPHRVPGVVEIERYVAKPYRKRGVGSALNDHALEMILEDPSTRAVLRTIEDRNLPALAARGKGHKVGTQLVDGRTYHLYKYRLPKR